MFIDITSALDDVTLEDDIFAESWSRAVALAAGKAAREEKRSRATRKRVAAERTTTDYTPVDPTITAFLAAHPAF